MYLLKSLYYSSVVPVKSYYNSFDFKFTYCTCHLLPVWFWLFWIPFHDSTCCTRLVSRDVPLPRSCARFLADARNTSTPKGSGDLWMDHECQLVHKYKIFNAKSNNTLFWVLYCKLMQCIHCDIYIYKQNECSKIIISA